MKSTHDLFLFVVLIVLIISSSYGQQVANSYDVLDESKVKNYSIPQQHKLLNRLLKITVRNNETEYYLSALEKKAMLFEQTKILDSTLFYSKQLLDFASTKKDSVWLLRANKNLANYFLKSDSLVTALTYYEKSVTLAEKLRDTVNILNNTWSVSNLQRKIGLLHESEASAIHVIYLLDHYSEDFNKRNYTYIGIYNHLGKIYRYLKQYKQALFYYNKALSLTEKVELKYIILNNIGYVYADYGEYNTALSYFYQSYQGSVKINDSTQIARALCNMGYAKYNLDDKKALKNLEESLIIREKLNHKIGLYSSYHHLACYYEHFNNSNKALFFIQKAYKIAIEFSLIEEQLEAMELLLTLGKTDMVRPYFKLRDSFENHQKATANKYLAIKYDFQKEHEQAKANEIKYLKSDLTRQQQEQRKRLWQIGFTLGCILFSFIIYIVIHRYRKKRLQEIYITENRIAKQVHDEIANDIYYTMHKMEPGSIIDEAALFNLEKIYHKTRDISKANSSIEITHDFSETLQVLLQGYTTDDLVLITTGLSTIQWDIFPEQKRITIYRVLQELLTNMRKHSKATLVKVSFVQNNKSITVNYWDNGVGTDLKVKSGLKHTENRIHATGGTIIFESEINQGFKANIIL